MKKTAPSKRAASNQKKPQRVSHAERSALMRKRLIDAATECLNELGLAATTLQRVTDKAGVSRGAIVHHFPTRVDLLVAVGESSATKQNKSVRRQLANKTPGAEVFEALTTATWNAMLEPPAIALLEILMGTRSDAELAKRFRPVIETLQEEQREDVWKQAELAGMKDREAVLTMVHLHVAAMRGLILELMHSNDRAQAENSIQLLRRYKTGLTASLRTEPNANRKAPPR